MVIFWLFAVILGAPVVSAGQCVPSSNSNFILSVSSRRNESGHWIVAVNTSQAITHDDNGGVVLELGHAVASCGDEDTVQMVTKATIEPSAVKTPITGHTSTAVISTTTTPEPLSDYQLFPGTGRYKVYPASMKRSWTEARRQCILDGADLMVSETDEERSIYLTLYQGVNGSNPWMGVYDPHKNHTWVTVKGESVPRTWWHPGEPDVKDRYCAFTWGNGDLANYDCAYERAFICEATEFTP